MGLKEREAVYYMLLFKYLGENKRNARSASRNVLYNCHFKALQMANYILAALDMNLDDSEVAVL